MKKTYYILLGLGAMGSAFGLDPNSTRDEKDANLYSSFGKRDPFRIPDRGGLNGETSQVDPLRKYRLEGYRLRAILRTGNRPQAMFEDPDGKSHVVVEGDRLGMEGARVSRIVNSEVIVTERSANYLGKETLLEKVISLPADQEGKSGSVATAVPIQQGYPNDGRQPAANTGASIEKPPGGELSVPVKKNEPSPGK